MQLAIERVQRLPVLSADHLPAGVRAALAGPAARQRARPDAARPPRRRGARGPGGRSEGPAGRGRRADRGQDRRRAAVRRGADQDGARIGPAARTRATATSFPARCRRSRSPRRSTTPCSRASTASPRSRKSPRSAPRSAASSPHALLAAVADRPEAELQAALDQLVSSELVFRRGAPPEATYSFKHALVQDAAYGTLLKSKRQHLHARIAQVLEEQFPETAQAQPELLAHHCTQAGLVGKAVDYWYKAGRQAMARSAMVEAPRS